MERTTLKERKFSKPVFGFIENYYKLRKELFLYGESLQAEDLRDNIDPHWRNLPQDFVDSNVLEKFYEFFDVLKMYLKIE